MKIEAKDHRVPEGSDVDLAKWPASVEHAHKSISEYHTQFGEHVELLSALQERLYACNQYAVGLAHQSMAGRTLVR